MDKIIEQKKGLKKKHIPYLLGGAFVLLFIGWLIFGNHSSTLRVEKDKINIEGILQRLHPNHGKCRTDHIHSVKCYGRRPRH